MIIIVIHKLFKCNLQYLLKICYNNAIAIIGGIDMDWAKVIKEIRLTCILSQEDFAKELGVSFTTVNRWEKGKNKP